MPDVLAPESGGSDHEDESPIKRRTRSTREHLSPEEDSLSNLSIIQTARNGERRIIIADKQLLANQAELQVMSLKHPKTGLPVMFLADEENRFIRELKTYSEEHRCWFIDETVESNGRLYIASKFDCLLLILPYIRRMEKKVPLEHLLVDPEYPDTPKLAPSGTFGKDMNKIADPIGSSDLNVWSYNEKKTLDYLAAKVKRLSSAMIARKLNTRGAASSGHFVASLNSNVDAVEYLRYAHGVLSDYLEDDLSEELAKKLELPKEDKESNARKRSLPSSECSNSSKKAKTSYGGPDEDYSIGYKRSLSVRETTLTPKQKALAKNASGSKSITSFFKKK